MPDITPVLDYTMSVTHYPKPLGKITVVIQQAYPGKGFENMMELNRERNQTYCDRNNFDYWHIIDDVVPEFDFYKGAWAKIELIRRALDKGYQYVIWLDADTLIWDTKENLINGCVPGKIGACWHRIPQLHHWNVGVLYVHNTERVKQFVNEWLAKYPGQNDGWNEQGEFNRMAMKSDIVETISDRWNATLNYSEVPDAVVLGFHGSPNRYETMKAVLNRRRDGGQSTAEVKNG